MPLAIFYHLLITCSDLSIRDTVWACDSPCLPWCSLMEPWSGGQCVQPIGPWSSPPQLFTVKSLRLRAPLDRVRDCSADSVAIVEMT